MPYKLVCFDIDGTLIDNVTSAWQLFHDHFRIDPQKRARARDDFYAGKITYCEWAEHDVALWIAQGATRERMIQAVTSLCVMKGALTAIGRLREKGIMLAVISGSVDLIPHALIPDFSDTFADVFINRLHFDSKGKLTGVEVTDFDIDGKAEALKRIAEREGIALGECVFVGDHTNDIKALKEAGLGIAFDPKDESLDQAADVVIREKDISLILPYILNS